MAATFLSPSSLAPSQRPSPLRRLYCDCPLPCDLAHLLQASCLSRSPAVLGGTLLLAPSASRPRFPDAAGHPEASPAEGLSLPGP